MAVLAHLEEQGFGVEVDVEAVAVAGERGVDRLSRGTVVCEEEDLVGGRALGACDGQCVAVVEADVAMDIAYFVGVEGDLAALFGGAVDADPFELEIGIEDGLDAPDANAGAVEQLVVPDGGADADDVALGDLELRALAPPGLPASGGHGDRRARDVRGVEHRAQVVVEVVDFGVGAGDDEARGMGVLAAVGEPVVGEALDGVRMVGGEVDAPALGVGVDGVAGVAVAHGLGRERLPALAGIGVAA